MKNYRCKTNRQVSIEKNITKNCKKTYHWRMIVIAPIEKFSIESIISFISVNRSKYGLYKIYNNPNGKQKIE